MITYEHVIVTDYIGNSEYDDNNDDNNFDVIVVVCFVFLISCHNFPFHGYI